MPLFDHLLSHGPAGRLFPDAVTYPGAIEACQMEGKADLSAALLLAGMNGVPDLSGTQMFRRSLGFNPLSNRLDFHHEAVLLRGLDQSERSPSVHPAVARAIFDALLDRPANLWGPSAAGINEQTVFVVGQHGADSIKATIAECMQMWGWTPVHPLHLNGVPKFPAGWWRSPRCYRTAPVGSPLQLDPDAPEFIPGKQASW